MPFATLVGHAQTRDLLRAAVAHGRVPQSLLFAGPEGVGKRTTAIALAQAVNCPQARHGDGCGVCSTCQRIASGKHADVVVLDQGEKPSIKIEALREHVLDVVGYRPFEASRRVFIIDPADALTSPDALLKTLEEPPASTILILISAYADTLLPTLQSRCRRLRFGALAEEDVARILVERCRVDPSAARTMAAMSAGSVATALATETSYADDDRAAAFGLLESAARERPAGRLRAAGRMAKHESKRRDREALSTRLAILASMLRDLGAAQAKASGVQLDPSVAPLIASYDLARAATGFLTVAQAQTWLERNAGPKIIADWVALSL